MDEQTAIISSAVLDKVYHGTNNILIGDVLNMIFGPLKSKKLNSANISVVG